MKLDNPVLNGYLYKKIEAAERLDEITPFTTGRVQRTLLIGYGQAAQIVDLFVSLGIVSIRDEDGNRHALVDPREAAIRVIRYMHRELEKAEEEQNAWEEENLPILCISDDDDDDDTDWLNEEVLTDMPISGLNTKVLLRKAVEVVCSFKRIGTSHLQRYLGIGYGRAAGLIDTLDQLGIIGPDPGTGRGREVFLSLEEALARIESYPDEET
jgi:DNA segregation ATPase FtsK/SpoIIIE-like protein